MRSARLGSRSEGFRMNVLPQASAMGNIHSGTIAGKLNGVIPAHTPTGCRSDQLSTSLPDVVAELTLDEMRDAGREFDDFDAARDRAGGVGERLAVLLGDDAREILLVRLEELAKPHQDAGAAQRGPRAPLRERRRGGACRGVDSSAFASGT